MQYNGPTSSQTDFATLAKAFFSLNSQQQLSINFENVDKFLSFLTVDNFHQVDWNNILVEGVIDLLDANSRKIHASVFAWIVYFAISKTHEFSQIILKRMSRDLPEIIDWSATTPHPYSSEKAIWLITQCAVNNQEWAKESLLNLANKQAEQIDWNLAGHVIHQGITLLHLIVKAAVSSSPSKDWGNKMLQLLVSKPEVKGKLKWNIKAEGSVDNGKDPLFWLHLNPNPTAKEIIQELTKTDDVPAPSNGSRVYLPLQTSIGKGTTDSKHTEPATPRKNKRCFSCAIS